MSSHAGNAYPDASTDRMLPQCPQAMLSGSCKLFVGNLNYGTGTARLREAFKVLPGFVSAKVHRDSKTGKSKGYACVKFYRPEFAEHATQFAHDSMLDGRKIIVTHYESARFEQSPFSKPCALVPDGSAQTPLAPRSHQFCSAILYGLPEGTSWRDLKLSLAQAGEITFVKVNQGGSAHVSFASLKDRENVISIFDGSSLLGNTVNLIPAGDTSYSPPLSPFYNSIPAHYQNESDHPAHLSEALPAEQVNLGSSLEAMRQQPIHFSSRPQGQQPSLWNPSTHNLGLSSLSPGQASQPLSTDLYPTSYDSLPNWQGGSASPGHHTVPSHSPTYNQHQLGGSSSYREMRNGQASYMFPQENSAMGGYNYTAGALNKVGLGMDSQTWPPSIMTAQSLMHAGSSGPHVSGGYHTMPERMPMYSSQVPMYQNDMDSVLKHLSEVTLHQETANSGAYHLRSHSESSDGSA